MAQDASSTHALLLVFCFLLFWLGSQADSTYSSAPTLVFCTQARDPANDAKALVNAFLSSNDTTSRGTAFRAAPDNAAGVAATALGIATTAVANDPSAQLQVLQLALGSLILCPAATCGKQSAFANPSSSKLKVCPSSAYAAFQALPSSLADTGSNATFPASNPLNVTQADLGKLCGKDCLAAIPQALSDLSSCITNGIVTTGIDSPDVVTALTNAVTLITTGFTRVSTQVLNAYNCSAILPVATSSSSGGGGSSPSTGTPTSSGLVSRPFGLSFTSLCLGIVLGMVLLL